MFKDNLFQLRKQLNLTQEELAGKIGVSRQAVAKWENGVSLPDLEKGSLLAEVLGVTLDDLINYRPEDNGGLCVPPKERHLFGVVTIGEEGQFVLPARARAVMKVSPGDQLVVLGSDSQWLALVKPDVFLSVVEKIQHSRE